MSSRKISSLRTVGTFLRRGSCSEALLAVLDHSHGHPLQLEENAAMHFAGGIAQYGYQCGTIWGATLAAGAEAYRRFGAGPHAEARAVLAAQRLVRAFRDRNREINCLELTDTDWNTKRDMLKYFLRGGPVGCFRLAARFAPAAREEIETAFAEEPFEAPTAPVSCAALVAQQMDASEMHRVMAAGLAGGIGLAGGGCGALGAAIWITSMKRYPGGAPKKWPAPAVQEVMEVFLKSADHEIECAEIVGRSFESIEDHATYVRDGGCAQILEALSGVPTS